MPVTLPFSLASDDEVRNLLAKHSIGLTIDEVRKISTLLGRDPTLVEAVIWGIQGSEHCSYKSSRRFLKNLPTNGRNVILGPKEDSGIVAITDDPPGKRWGIVVSHESHNKPSQIVPYEGAATGVGGNIRDVMCMGARVIGIMDALRLGDLKTDETRTIAREVVRGIAGYGNPLGIPNLGGDTVFDGAYNQQCLVNVVCHGIIREDEIIHSYAPEEAGRIGYDIIIVGKPTDRSGFGGASFASLTLDEKKKERNTGAVQEPNPFLERHLLAATYALFDWLAKEKHLSKVGFKDLGAGGVVCSSVEQVADLGLGADIDLNKVHTALDDLPPEVIACAETQERFCWVCHPDLTGHILTHYNVDWDLPSIAENARASVVGKVTNSPLYRLFFNGEIVCEAKSSDITCGLQYNREIKEQSKSFEEPTLTTPTPEYLRSALLTMLAHPNAGDMSAIYRHYDKNVMGNSIVEPGEADAGVIAPLQNLASYVHEGEHPDWTLPEGQEWTGVALSVDGNARYGKISPYLQGVNAVIESIRNVVSTGATPRALTDCLNYGNPEDQEKLWELSEGVRGVADAAKGISIGGEPIPVISGNVSLYNGSIPPSAIVSAIGVMADARKAVTQSIRSEGLQLYLIGDRKDECGGSLYYDVMYQTLGAHVPKPDFDEVHRQINFVLRSAENQLLECCHDIGEGGLLMTLFEMLLPVRRAPNPHGMALDLSTLFLSSLPLDTILFTETGGFVIAVKPENIESIEALSVASEVSLIAIGKSTLDSSIVIQGSCTFSMSDCLERWSAALRHVEF